MHKETFNNTKNEEISSTHLTDMSMETFFVLSQEEEVQEREEGVQSAWSSVHLISRREFSPQRAFTPHQSGIDHCQTQDTEVKESLFKKIISKHNTLSEHWKHNT